MDANGLRRKALTWVVGWQLILALLLFVPAWSARFWEAWVYWTLFFFAELSGTLYFLKRDPALVESRLKFGPTAEHEKSQKVIQALVGVLACAVWVVPGIERRFHPSVIPRPLVLVADAIVVAGFVITFSAGRENSYASSVIEVTAGQRVVSTGVYGLVRHPMYAGGLLMLLATPLALGSLWALVFAVALCGVVAARLLDEERYLSGHLAGYKEYCGKVRYRLIPYVW
ncbi:MAG TPA: isoprenylcysteine carboxylmethyltransferase family protein [Myxococcota bacterium]|nr:isoprenylcysteine carboxylmethyltransferase family protein [Myxococcota bacterium]